MVSPDLPHPGPASPGPADLDPVVGPVAARRTRVLLMAEERLVGDALCSALSTGSLEVVAMGWPDDHRPIVLVRRAIANVRPAAGIVVGELEDPLLRAQARMLVAAVPLRWMAVVRDVDDVGWGGLLDAGATLLPTSVTLDEMAEGIVRLLGGADTMPVQTRRRIVREWRELRDETDRMTARLDRLSRRETTVLDHLADGLTIKEIAVVDRVSEATVRTQVKAVLRKLEVGSQLAAVVRSRAARSHRRTNRSRRVDG